MPHIDFYTLIGYFGASDNLFGKRFIKILNKIHYSAEIGICLIKLNRCELRIMLGVHSLVPEYTSDLINAVHSADYQTL